MGSALTLGSSFDVGELNLKAEGSIEVDGSIFTNKFHSFSGVDFLSGSGHVTTGQIRMTALNNLNFDARRFSAGDFSNITVTLTATNSLNIDPSGQDQSVFSEVNTFAADGGTIKLIASAPTIIMFNPAAASVSFSAGTGGIQGTNVGLDGFNSKSQRAGYTIAAILPHRRIRRALARRVAHPARSLAASRSFEGRD